MTAQIDHSDSPDRLQVTEVSLCSGHLSFSIIQLVHPGLRIRSENAAFVFYARPSSLFARLSLRAEDLEFNQSCTSLEDAEGLSYLGS